MAEILSKEESEVKTQEQLNKIKTPCPCKKKMNSGEELERRITAFSDCASQCIVWRMPYEVAVDMLASFKETEKNKEQRDKLIYATSVASRRSRTLMTLLKENNVFND